MLEFYEPGAAIIESSIAKTVERMGTTNKRALDFMLGVKKMMLEEAIFASNEIFDRVRAETQLLSEFSSKIAGVHSVDDLKTVCEECGQHQIDFVRQDSERIFKQGERIIEATTKLFNSQPQI